MVVLSNEFTNNCSCVSSTGGKAGLVGCLLTWRGMWVEVISRWQACTRAATTARADRSEDGLMAGYQQSRRRGKTGPDGEGTRGQVLLVAVRRN